jgi:hypothetical protein
MLEAKEDWIRESFSNLLVDLLRALALAERPLYRSDLSSSSRLALLLAFGT